ncbi:Gibberellin 3-beta-dioxygenase [Rhynchospora pubera]|uniref:Gibberellin 3-beta-dioxygenase n=2 Tax=Rhynchospora pubera TaxID=906938 RepID=A0AAV8CCM9_9POAL|nr:Gibberellin 3-beta-dioxygenase [Rhynchospora pubera]
MSLHTTRNLKIHQPENFEFDSIPDSHSWDDVHDHPSVEPIGPDAIPVIDLNDPKLIAKIGKACEEWGIFIISNHGIESELLNQLCSQMHRLFALPAEVKLKVAKTEGNDAGYGGAPVSHFFPKFSWSEGFAIVGSPVDHAKKLWPDDYSSFCEIIEEYNKAINSLGCRLIHAMLLSLGVSEEELCQTPIGDSSKVKTAMHLNSYPACTNPDWVLGLPPHTDSAYVAILYQNGVPGLQVLRCKDDISPTRWVTVPAVPNTFVVNIGDLLHVLSNGRFHNVLHRVTISKINRLSCACFFGPQADVKVGPLSKLAGLEQSPLYRPVTWPGLKKIRSVLHDKALQAIKIDSNYIEG